MSRILNLPFLVVHCPLLKIFAREAASEGFSATMKAVFIVVCRIYSYSFIYLTITLYEVCTLLNMYIDYFIHT